MFNVRESQEDFESLPLDSQLDFLEKSMAESEPIDLLHLCAPLRDPAPLAWLSKRLLISGWLRDIRNNDWFTSFLIQRPETSVLKILKAMLSGALSPEEQECMARVLVSSMEKIPLERLSTMCVIDRMLKHNYFDERQAFIESMNRTVEESLLSDSRVDVDLKALAQVPASRVVELTASLPDEKAIAFRELRRDLARRAISILEAAPKGVSQTNAEDLLARRVYTDPGHFLIELLQNAEDTGAKTWKVIFDVDKLIVWHDGLPFDIRDLVGITSIGQTTKRKQQIGFFGVGFKSVYEITDRPQVYSDVYQFEIADVSIPKYLAVKPANLPEGGTSLLLPLREGLDEARSPRILYEKAAQLDACVLLTLRNIDRIELELTAAAGGPARHALIECATSVGASIRHEPSGSVATYLLQDDEFNYEGSEREAGRPQSTKVMVGALLDETSGEAIPLKKQSAQVYSYLPTRESPGLKFFLQGHFDVPVDRERIAPDSEWNRWILSKVSLQLARLASKVSVSNSEAEALGFLSVLPLKEDLPHLPFSLIPIDMEKYFSKLSILPAVDGSLHTPEATFVAGQRILQLFDQERPGEGAVFLSERADERARELVLQIGGRRFEAPQLLDFLEQALLRHLKNPDEHLPRFLFVPEKLEILYDILLEELEIRERTGGDARSWLSRIYSLPVILDQSGWLRQAHAVWRGSDELRQIYSGIRNFVDRGLEGDENSRSRAFLDRIGVKSVSLNDLVDDLEKSLSSAPIPLKSLSSIGFPASEENRHLIIKALCSAEWELQKRAALLPLFKATDGWLWPAAESSDDTSGVLRAYRSKEGLLLSSFYGNSRPIVQISDPPTPSDILMSRIDSPMLSLAVLVDDLERELLPLEISNVAQLHELLEQLCDSLTESTMARLLMLEIWPNMQMRLMSLSGGNIVRIAADENIVELFPHTAFLSWNIARKRHVKVSGIHPIGAEDVVEAIAEHSESPLKIERSPDSISKALDYLLANHGALSSRHAQTLRSRGVLISDRNEVLPLGSLHKAESDQLRTLYGNYGDRHFISAKSAGYRLIKEIGIESALPIADTALLGKDIEAELRSGGIERVFNIREVIRYLASNLGRLPQSLLSEFTRLPIWKDTEGKAGSLPDSETVEIGDKSLVFPVEASVRPMLSLLDIRLLDREIEDLAAGIIKSAKIYRADIQAVVETLRTQPLSDENTLVEAQKTLLKHREQLSRFYPHLAQRNQPNPVLNSLAIWFTIDGSAKGAAQILDGDLTNIFEPGTEASSELEGACLPSDQFNRLSEMAPFMLPRSPETFLADLIKRYARPEKKLSEQVGFLSSTDKIARLHRLIQNEKDVQVPFVNATGRLTFNDLYLASEDTIALLEGLSILEKVLSPELAKALSLSGMEKRGLGSQMAKLWRQFTEGDVAHRFKPMPPKLVLEGIIEDFSSVRREKFYNWLVANETDFFFDKDAVMELRRSALFVTTHGSLIKPTELLLDGDFPELGIDWLPGNEIPKELLEILSKRLDIGKPHTEDLIKSHVLPAYLKATKDAESERAGRLLTWIARKLEDRSPREIQKILPVKSKTFLIESSIGSLVRPQELVLPPHDLMESIKDIWGDELLIPSTERYDKSMREFLLAVGVLREPSDSRIAKKLSEVTDKKVSLGLARLARHLRETEGEAFLSRIGAFRNAAWLLDGAGNFKAPFDLFRNKPEISSIIGNSPQSFIDSDQQEILGSSLSRSLGFREVEDITLEEVASNLRRHGENNEPISFEPYRWLERSVSYNEISGKELEQTFGESRWICTDDGDYRNHREVIGTRVFHIFGGFRGYWTTGFRQCPKLCELLRIPEEAYPEIIRSFISEIGAKAAANPAALLEKEPALPLMLLNSFSILGEHGLVVERNLPLIPCDLQGQVKLLPASSPNLYWSDTPTLEKLFAATGALYLARKGSGDDRESVERFHRIMGIRRLRDNFQILVDSSPKADQSESKKQQLSHVRSILTDLLGVIPRIEIERHLDADSSWVYGSRLDALAHSGSIRAIEKLSVKYSLSGVGETSVEKAAAFDIDKGELLIDTRVLSNPELTGLAEGLMPAIIDGPQAETFVDLFEILIARGQKDQMDEYLNRRHFAGIARQTQAPDEIAKRIGEIIDYGLTKKLKDCFPVLKDAELNSWREQDTIGKIRGCNAGNRDEAAKIAVPIMIEKLGLKFEVSDLTDLLLEMLTVATISDASECLSVRLRDRQSEEKTAESSGMSNSNQPEILDQEQSLHDTINSAPKKSFNLKNFFSIGKKNAEEPVSPQDELVGNRKEKKGFWQKMFEFSSDSEEERDSLEGDDHSEGNDSENEISDYNPERESSPPSEWLGGNYFRPSKNIGPQLWFTSKNRKLMEDADKPARLFMSPRQLPTPYQYAIQKVGTSFDPLTQTWRFTRASADLFKLSTNRSGRFVSFSGTLYSGDNILPMPLYSRLSGQVRSNKGDVISTREELSSLNVRLEGGYLLDVSYDVELMEVPDLLIGDSSTHCPDKALLKPTTPFNSLPHRLQTWIQKNRNDVEPRTLAHEVQDFVRRYYCYYEDFMEIPEVKARKKSLRLFRGNHHLELLHASGNDTVLGHGVCYELNVLIVEILRHLGIPACIATGWVLDEQIVDLPDHLFALAVMPSANGPCLLPLEGAATNRGAIRTLSQNREFAAPPEEMTRRPIVPKIQGEWDLSPGKGRSSVRGRASSGSRGDWHSSTPTYVRFEDLHKTSKYDGEGNLKNAPAKSEEPLSDFLSKFGFKSPKSAGPGDKGIEDARNRASKILQKDVEDLEGIQKAIESEQDHRERAEAKLERERKQKKRLQTEAAGERRQRKHLENRLSEAMLKYEKLTDELNQAKQQLEEFELGNSPKRIVPVDNEQRNRGIESQIRREALERVANAMGIKVFGIASDLETSQRLEELLGSKKVADKLVDILRYNGLETDQLSEEIRTLAALGIVHIETIPTIRIIPKGPDR